MKKSFFLNLIFVNCFLSFMNGQRVNEFPLYPEGIQNNPVHFEQEESYVDSLVNPQSLSQLNRVYSYISEPTYMLFPARDSNNKQIGLVIFPGGGYVNNWIDKEGTDLALWLSANGISCMVVKYRTNKKDQNGKYLIPFDQYKNALYQDGRNSILKMKSFSDSLHFDQDKVGIVGFSAGAWLAGRMAFKYYDKNYAWRPAFIGLIYYGRLDKDYKKIKNKNDLPPFFMALARDDHKLPVRKVIPDLTKLLLDVNKSELHIYAKGDHGFGLAYDNGFSVELWKENFIRWLMDIYNYQSF